MKNRFNNHISSIASCLKSALQGKEIVMTIADSEDPDQTIVTVELPLKPEDGIQINPIDLIVNADGSISFEYVINAGFSTSEEKGCIVANAINDAMSNAPIKCIYHITAREFVIISTINNSNQLIQTTNRLLSILEFIIISTNYLEGDDSNKDYDFDCIFSVGDYANDSLFENYNIVD